MTRHALRAALALLVLVAPLAGCAGPTTPAPTSSPNVASTTTPPAPNARDVASASTLDEAADAFARLRASREAGPDAARLIFVEARLRSIPTEATNASTALAALDAIAEAATALALDEKALLDRDDGLRDAFAAARAALATVRAEAIASAPPANAEKGSAMGARLLLFENAPTAYSFYARASVVEASVSCGDESATPLVVALVRLDDGHEVARATGRGSALLSASADIGAPLRLVVAGTSAAPWASATCDSLIAHGVEVRRVEPPPTSQAADDLESTMLALIAETPAEIDAQWSALAREVVLPHVARHGSIATTLVSLSGSGQAQLLEATKQMQETQMSFNLQYLQLQSQMQHESRSYTAISNIMKTKHDTVKNSISNVR